MMNYNKMTWKERSDQKEEYLKQINEWTNSSKWLELPEGVRMAILYGKQMFRDDIERFEAWAKEEGIE